MKKVKLPNPGSDEALDMGCTCPVLDNGHGRGSGYINEDGVPAFWTNADCPLHGYKDKYEKAKKAK